MRMCFLVLFFSFVLFRFFLFRGGVCSLVGRLENTKNRSICGPHFYNISVVPQIGSEIKMWDVGCDRRVFAINSNLLLIKTNYVFNKWSLDQGQKTINS